MKYLLPLLLLACTRDRLVNVSDCGKPCETQCGQGYYVCEDDGGVTCLGARAPAEETCNGIDDDCDNQIDEGSWACESPCGRGTFTCKSPCSAPAPSPEVCNSKDDDCNGAVDDNLPIEFCYTGPQGSAGKGVCAPGFKKCDRGGAYCANQTLPRPETCNQLDDDCDGEVDEGTSSTQNYDIVFIFDNSGSMSGYISIINPQLEAWAVSQPPSVRFGAIGAPPPYDLSSVPRVVLPLTAIKNDFILEIWKQDGYSGSGFEATLDAIDLAVTDMSWRLDALRFIIVISDEPSQTYDGTPPLSWAGHTVHVFTALSSYADWQTRPVDGIWDLSAFKSTDLDWIILSKACP